MPDELSSEDLEILAEIEEKYKSYKEIAKEHYLAIEKYCLTTYSIEKVNEAKQKASISGLEAQTYAFWIYVMDFLEKG